MKNKIAMNLQLFAEPTGGTGSEGGTPPAGGEGAATGQQTIQFDYEKLASIVAGKQSATEETVLKQKLQISRMFLRKSRQFRKRIVTGFPSFLQKQLPINPRARL